MLGVGLLLNRYRFWWPAFLCVLVHRDAALICLRGFNLNTTMVNIDNESSSSWNEKIHPDYAPDHAPDHAPSKNKSCWRRWSVVIIAALMLLILALALGLGLGLGLQQNETEADVIVDLGYSKYRGQAFSDGTCQWLGMRYAAAPVGQLRFAAPRGPPTAKKVQPALAVSR